jgi:hypothetical protein
VNSSAFQLTRYTPISVARKLFVYALDLLPQLLVVVIAPVSMVFVGFIVKRAGG